MSATGMVSNFQNLDISDSDEFEIVNDDDKDDDYRSNKSNECDLTIDGATTVGTIQNVTQKSLQSVRVNTESSEIEIDGNMEIVNPPPNSAAHKKQTALAKEVIENVFGNSTCSFGDVTVRESAHVRVGNTTQVNIHGPVNINYNVNKVEYRRELKQSIFMEAPPTAASGSLIILDRISWIAQPPLEENPRQKPANLVIICHTATESSFRQAGNVLLIRSMQTYHIESKEWSDIAYNFMIGCDSQVYEGRGWKNIGAHTKGLNANSIGIAFIGTFMRVPPPESALNACQKLIEYGVEIGEIDKNYKLVAHCQSRPFESPGRALFEIIKTWPHWTSQV